MAASLHESGRTPLLCGRRSRTHLELQVDGASVVVPGPVETDASRAKGPADMVFLCVKATQTRAAGSWLGALCGPDTVVCVLQNGVEQVPTVEPLAHGAQVVPAVVWFPAQAQPDGAVWLRGAPRLTLPDVPAAHLVAQSLLDTRFAVELTGDFTSATWRKLLQNAAAGLMALTGRRAGMFGRTDIAGVTLDYLRECLAVGRAEGAVLGDEVPREILAAFQASPPDLGTSILADRAAGRPLEWDTRNGVISRIGRRHGILTPISDVVSSLLAATSDGPG